MAYTIKDHKEEFVKALMDEGYSEDAAIYILETREEDEDQIDLESSVRCFFEAFNEYDNEQELLDAVRTDSALYNEETEDWDEPTMDYVYKHYCVGHLDNGHVIVNCTDPQ